MLHDMSEILLDESKILKRVSALAAEISRDYKDETPIIVGILKGSFIFMSDLVRCLTISVQVDFMQISSYGDSSKSSGIVRIKKDLDTNIEGKHVIIVEDIVDSGLTLKNLIEHLKARNPKSIKICALLDKPLAHQTEVKIDYVGFEVGNEFAVGYGLDYAEKYRNLPYIAILKEEIYK